MNGTLTSRTALHIGQKLTTPDGQLVTVVPTAKIVPDDEVNVMHDHTGSVTTVRVDQLTDADAQFRPPDTIPGVLLAHLAEAWPARQSVSTVYAVTNELARDHPDVLDHVERDLRESLIRGVANRSLVLISDSGPIWTFRQGMVVRPSAAEPDIRERVWDRGDPVPGPLGYLVCRIHADAISPLPKKVKRDGLGG